MTHFVLLSGGLDSTTVVRWVQEHHPAEPVEAVTVLYGQKHVVELQAARQVAQHYGIAHHELLLPPITGSALTDADRDIPRGRDLDQLEGVAPTYVPARNLFFIAALASYADARGSGAIWLGVHHDDYTGYPDCRPEFIAAADQAVNLGTKHQLRVRAPFVDWRKPEILRWGLEHEVPYALTHSCYAGSRPACGECDTCRARLRAFAEAGVEDPLAYGSKR